MDKLYILITYNLQKNGSAIVYKSNYHVKFANWDHYNPIITIDDL